MAPEVAINTLDNLKIFYGDCSLDVEAMDAGIDALNKEIPKKPLSSIDCCSVKSFQCPCCKHYIVPKQECCMHCGQAIDWSDD